MLLGTIHHEDLQIDSADRKTETSSRFRIWKMELESFKNLIKVNTLFKGLTVEKFRQILSCPMWNIIVETIDCTRSYEAGLETGLTFLKYAEEFREFFSREEHRKHLQTLYLFILHNLDKLDKWEEYIDVWEKIRANTDFSMTYSKDSRERHGKIIEPFILSEDDKTLYVHFLYPGHRKKIIERKLARKQAGKKLGNQFHARQEELTDGEIKHRFNRMVKKAQFIKKLEELIKRASRMTN